MGRNYFSLQMDFLFKKTISSWNTYYEVKIHHNPTDALIEINENYIGGL